MKKYLWLDDNPVRDPKDNKHPWVIVRTYEEAVRYVEMYGFPDFVDFDHDLGEGKTGKDFANFLVNLDMDTHTMPADFEYNVHSSNTGGGAENIEGLLDNYLDVKRKRALGLE